MEAEYVARYRKKHRHQPGDNQCSSLVFKHIKAPLDIVWSLVRRFDEPQLYKPFISNCRASDDLKIGSLREVNVKSGLPATTSTERLEVLDDQEHVLSVKFIGGDHRLKNYSSVTTLHPEGERETVIVESFVVDVPEGNTKEETCYFVKVLINFNLMSLADISERMAIQAR
ncbi:hypothetical protein M569_08746, partial [Genlisea aurea]